jgi:tetratricopeptide (TPR) repeat protein
MLSFLLYSSLFSIAKAESDNGLKDYKKGLQLYQQSRYEQALERFQQAIDENLEFWQAYQMVGYCCFELHQKDEAIKAFEESLDLNPNNSKLSKVYKDLKSGALDVPVRPVAEASSYYIKF